MFSSSFPYISLKHFNANFSVQCNLASTTLQTLVRRTVFTAVSPITGLADAGSMATVTLYSVLLDTLTLFRTAWTEHPLRTRCMNTEETKSASCYKDGSHTHKVCVSVEFNSSHLMQLDPVLITPQSVVLKAKCS